MFVWNISVGASFAGDVLVMFCTMIDFLLGEMFELKAELNSDKKDRKKEAVKKVIASMTVGKDVR